MNNNRIGMDTSSDARHATRAQIWKVSYKFSGLLKDNYPLITEAKLAERIRASLLRHHTPQLSFEDVQLYLDDIQECPNDVVSHIIYNES